MACLALSSYVDQNRTVSIVRIQDVRKLRKDKDFITAYEILGNFQEHGLTKGAALLEKVNLLVEESRHDECESVLNELMEEGGQYCDMARFRLVRLFSQQNNDNAYNDIMHDCFSHVVDSFLCSVTKTTKINSKLVTPLAGGHIVASRLHVCGDHRIFEKVRRKVKATVQEGSINEALMSIESSLESVRPKYWGKYESESYVSMFFDDLQPEKCDVKEHCSEICNLISRYHRQHPLDVLADGIPVFDDIVIDAKGKPSIRTICGLSNQFGKSDIFAVKTIQEFGYSLSDKTGAQHMRSFFSLILDEKIRNMLGSNPVVLQHGDLNKTNILYSNRLGGLRLIDWEVAGPGILGYDFGYFLSQQNMEFSDLIVLCADLAKQYESEQYPNVMFSILFFYLLCVSFLHPNWVKGVGKETYTRTTELITKWIK